MELKDLEPGERAVLAAALEFTVLADGRASGPEAAALDRIVSRMGQAEYEQAMEAAERDIPDLDALESHLALVTRPEARELIFGTVLEAAIADAATPGENTVLDRMTRMWNIAVRVDPTPEPLDTKL